MRRNFMNRRRALYGTLYSSTALRSPSGRIMKDPEGQGGQTGAENNGGGNTGDSGQSGSGAENNGGQEFNAAGFWEEPADENSNSGTPTPTPTPNQETDPGKKLGQDLNQALTGLKFGDLFTAEIAEQVANGDLKGANEAFGTQLREAVKQSVVMNTQVVKAMGEHIMNQVKSQIAEALGGEKNDAALIAAFPSAKDPAVYKTIKGVFDQAMKHTKNNREAATAMTRDMLKFVNKSTGRDLGIDEAPPGRDDTFSLDSNSKSLVESLLSMGS